MQDQEWHEFIQDDRSTFPPDNSLIQVIFASGRLIKGTWHDGMLSHEYKILKLQSRAGDTSNGGSLAPGESDRALARFRREGYTSLIWPVGRQRGVRRI